MNDGRGQGARLEIPLIEMLTSIVDAQNEVDFVGIFNCKNTDRSNPFVIMSAESSNPARRIETEEVEKSIYPYVNSFVDGWNSRPRNGFEFSHGEVDLVGKLPCWDSRNSKEEQITYGYYVLFVSKTPEGEQIFRNTIMHHGPNIVRSLERYLRQIAGQI